MQQAQQILQQYWGFNQFRGLQESIVNAVVEQQDVLAILPTGGGKSICFQVPALMSDGLCIVVSPLIALMKDQVQNLQKKNISAIAIYSGLTSQQVEQVLINASKGNYKFLYVSPERLKSNIFLEYLDVLNVNLIAVDEAHCISQWGYDFRPPYLQIAELRKLKPKVPIIALTASATSFVQKDIVQKLQLKNTQQFQQSFQRPNISYSVFKVESKINKAIDILQSVAGSGIIYCKNRSQTSYVAHLLQLQNISATHYHAGLLQEERSEKQNNWLQNKTRVMVCTNAFGMGIDKPDVRVVIHYDVPDCVENYYQEAGRAGRDNKRAFAILLYNNKDIETLKHLPTLRFPSIEIIKNIYQSLVNYLQIPVGLGENESFDFDVLSFTKNFNLELLQTLSVLKTLEHEQIITVTDAIYTPSKIQVTASRNSIDDFSSLYPNLENTFKALLRTYANILDNEVNINEKVLAKVCSLSYDKINENLDLLAQYQIINYKKQKDIPQIIFNINRPTAENLYINTAEYFKRKIQFEIRVKAIIDYVINKKSCRSQIISSYFSATEKEACGCCDTCINLKQKDLTPQEFEQIEKKILKYLENDATEIKKLLSMFKNIKKDKLWQVLNFLQDEKKITINKLGAASIIN